MSVQLSVTIPDLGRIKRKLDQAPAQAGIELNRAIRISALYVASNAKKELGGEKGGWDTGRMANSITPRFGLLRAEIAPRVNYAVYVHEGTGPHWAPISALAPWAKRHGIDPHAVQHAIARKGTKANPFMARAIEASQEGITKEFTAAFERILDL